MRIALYEPDIPQNTGAVLRLGACLGVGVAIIGTPGFVLSDRHLRRAGMDYIRLADISRYGDLEGLRADLAPGARVILCTTRAALESRDVVVARDFRDVAYGPDDVILMGSESAGVPDSVHAGADLRVTIPLAPGARSLNVALAAAMVLGEALRRTGGFPGDTPPDT